METDLSDSQVKCVICGEILEYGNGTVLTPVGVMCGPCGIECRRIHKELEERAKKKVLRDLQRWVDEQQAVKQFYSRQTVLPNVKEEIK